MGKSWQKTFVSRTEHTPVNQIIYLPYIHIQNSSPEVSPANFIALLQQIQILFTMNIMCFWSGGNIFLTKKHRHSFPDLCTASREFTSPAFLPKTDIKKPLHFIQFCSIFISIYVSFIWAAQSCGLHIRFYSIHTEKRRVKNRHITFRRSNAVI